MRYFAIIPLVIALILAIIVACGIVISLAWNIAAPIFWHEAPHISWKVGVALMTLISAFQGIFSGIVTVKR